MKKERTLFDFELQLQKARSLPEMNHALQEYLLKLQITTFSFTYYSYYPNSLNKLKFDFASANFEPWHQHYISEHYEEIDSTLEKVYQTTLPTYWELQQQLRDATSEKERQMRLDSIAFGAEKGLSIPIHGPQEDFAIFLVVQMRNETCLQHWRELQYELFTAGYFFYTYLQALLLKNQEPVEKHNLTQRDLQCLTLLAKQYSLKAIAENLNITERTVNYHIQKLNKKLGVKNKYQAVAKALEKGLIRR
jgi:DNA-binding CsgD family transcriptional regulator